MTIASSRLLVVGALATSLALTGCSVGGDDDNSGDGATTSDSSSKDSAPAAGTNDNGGKAAGIDPAKPPKAIASITLPGEDTKEVTDSLVELVAFERRGKILMAVFRVTAHGPKEKTSLWSAFQWDPTLYDLVNLKSYGDVQELTNGYTTDLVIDEPKYVMAGFAIPENTDTIDVGVNRTGPRMEGVTIP